jgi:hypothetical protein
MVQPVTMQQSAIRSSETINAPFYINISAVTSLLIALDAL